MKKIILAIVFYLRRSSKKKIFLIVFILIVLSSIIIRKPVHITLPVTGKVLDATTGEPIENAIIFCEWVKTIGFVGGDVSSVITSVTVATDKNGNYYIPMKITFQIISWFSEMSVNIIHPLYVGNGARLYRRPKTPTGYEEGITNAAGKIAPGLLVKKGTIHYDVKLLSLEERYKENPWYYLRLSDISSPEYLSDKFSYQFKNFREYVELCDKKGSGFNKEYFLNKIQSIKRTVENYNDEQLYKIRINEIKSSCFKFNDVDCNGIKNKLRNENDISKIMLEKYRKTHRPVNGYDIISTLSDYDIICILNDVQKRNTLCREIDTKNLNLTKEAKELLLKVKRTLITNEIPDKKDVLILNKVLLMEIFQNETKVIREKENMFIYNNWLKDNPKKRALKKIYEIEKIICEVK